mgnify:CR=1 FL=1
MKFIYKNDKGEEAHLSDRGSEEDKKIILSMGFVLAESIPEIVEEEDMLEGHTYPGHEMWDENFNEGCDGMQDWRET